MENQRDVFCMKQGNEGCYAQMRWRVVRRVSRRTAMMLLFYTGKKEKSAGTTANDIRRDEGE